MRLYNTDKPQRLEEETQEEYRIRQRLNKAVLKDKLKGRLNWDSKYYGEATPENIARVTKMLIEEELLKQK